MSGHPDYEQPRQVTPYATVVLADNPSAMTLQGTNTWLLRGPGEGSAVVVDPGPEDERHLGAVAAAAGTVSQILLTHGHPDHSEGARRLRELTGAGVRALDPRYRLGDEGLVEGDVVAASGVEVRVWATPGHTADSLSFVVDDLHTRAVLTGDTILGSGTTVVAHPDGNLRDYLASLRRLRELGDTVVLPGHGPELDAAAAAASYYLQHRQQRLDQIRAVLDRLGPDVAARTVVEHVYRDVDRGVWWAAELSVRAQLAYLRGE